MNQPTETELVAVKLGTTITTSIVRTSMFSNALLYRKMFSTTSPFPLKDTLQMSAEKFSKGNGVKYNFDNTIVCGVQHILGTTVDMASVLKINGLQCAIFAGKSYSTNRESYQRLQDEKNIGFDYIQHEEQLGYGTYTEANQMTVQKMWSSVDQYLRKIHNIKEKLVQGDVLSDLEAAFKNKYSSFFKDQDLIHRLRQLKGNTDEYFKLITASNPALFILDDGGRALTSVRTEYFNGVQHKPSAILGVEQTAAGTGTNGNMHRHYLFNGLPFHIINVANAFVKQLERAGVAEAVVEKSEKALQQACDKLNKVKPIIGIIGYGDQGKALTKKLIGLEYDVLVFDTNKRSYDELAKDISVPITTLLNQSDVIYSCTGIDLTGNEDILDALLHGRGRKCLISISSEDKEFRTLLLKAQSLTKSLGVTPSVLEDITLYLTKNNGAVGISRKRPHSGKYGEIEILRGGFPVNFDNSEHSVKPELIWPTRAALMSALFSALSITKAQNRIHSPEILKPDLNHQKFIIDQAKKLQSNNSFFEAYGNEVRLFKEKHKHKLKGKNDEELELDFIAEHSGGKAWEIKDNILNLV
jgi:hypothetical protein